MDANEPVIRGYADGDERGILDLFVRCYGHALDASAPDEVWRWFYRPTGTERPLVKIASVGDRVVAQYAVVPRRMKVGSWTGTGTLSLHTMTDPEFQGRKLFTRLAQALYAQLREEGVGVTYGFPNSESVHGFTQRLGWTEPFDLPIHLFPVNPPKILRAKGMHPLIAGFAGTAARGVLRKPRPVAPPAECEIAEVERPSPGVDRLWQRAATELPIALLRDRAFVDRRFARTPFAQYRILEMSASGEMQGYVVVRTSEVQGLKVGFIMDILAWPNERRTVDPLLSAAFTRLNDENVDAVSCLMNPTTPAGAALAAMHFIQLKPSQFPEEMHFGYLRHLDAVAAPLLGSAANWYLTWADSDVI